MESHWSSSSREPIPPTAIEVFFENRAEQAEAICFWEDILAQSLKGDTHFLFAQREVIFKGLELKLRTRFPRLSKNCYSALLGSWWTATGQALRAQNELRVLCKRFHCSENDSLVLGQRFFSEKVGSTAKGRVRLMRDGFFWHLLISSGSDGEQFMNACDADGALGCAIPYTEVSDGGWPIRLLVTHEGDDDHEGTYRHERAHAIHQVIGHAFAGWEPDSGEKTTEHEPRMRHCKDELLAWIVDGSRATVIEFHLAETSGYEYMYAGATEEEMRYLKGCIAATCRELVKHPAMQTPQAAARERLWAELVDVPLKQMPSYLRAYNRTVAHKRGSSGMEFRDPLS